MKNLIKIFSIILLFIYNILAQEETTSPNCIDVEITDSYNGQIGGYVLPSDGTVNVLIVFIQFPDDSYDTTNTYWVKGEAPANSNYWVNQAWSSNPIEGSLTHYFNEMSFNKLKFTGKTASVVTPHTRQWYLNNNKRRGDIHKEVIQFLDASWSFEEFDNWDLEDIYQHSNKSDNIVEMIIMVWRNIANEFTGSIKNQIYSDLDMQYSYGTLGGSAFSVDNGARIVKTGFGANGSTPSGSGVTIVDHLLQKNLQTPIHEFAHYLMGGNSYHVGYGFWGMLEAFGRKSKVANSFERYRLGWINTIGVNNSPNQTISNATLSDYVTTGISYRLNINTSNNEFFYIENHQKLSYWEQNITSGNWANNSLVYGNIENGLYLLRQDGFVGGNVQIVPADGRFEWVVNQRIQSPWGPELLPVFKNLGANITGGYHDLQYIPWEWNGINQPAASIHFTEDENGNPVQDVRYPGDGKDAFRLGHNEVFSPWSNPNSQDKDRDATPFGFKINSESNGVYSIDIYVNTASNAPPSKPQDVKVTVNGQFKPVVTWNTYLEPDMTGGKYKIYRAFTSGGEPTNFNHIGTINITGGDGPSTYSYTDLEICQAGSGTHKIFYTVSAVDNTNKESVKADYDWVPYNPVACKEVVTDNDEKIILEYKLYSNFPNPFNPQTTIQYDVKESGLVQLRIYDVLGKEIAKLVNEFKEEGEHYITFDAADLPSGIYVYSIKVNDFVSNQKMLLLK